MLKIGVTGGIGSGKSTVCEIFKTLGIPVFNADEAGRALTDGNKEVKDKIRENFGSEIFDGGTLNRRKLAEIVFEDADKLKQLNDIIHPTVGKAYADWVNDITDKPYCLKEAAILFESGSDKGLDKVIVVSAPQELRIERVVKRDDVTREEVRGRMNRQRSEEERIARADFVINNDGSNPLIPQVMELHEKLLAL